MITPVFIDFLLLSCSSEVPVRKIMQIRINNRESKGSGFFNVRLNTVKLTAIIKMFLAQSGAFPFWKRI